MALLQLRKEFPSKLAFIFRTHRIDQLQDGVHSQELPRCAAGSLFLQSDLTHWKEFDLLIPFHSSLVSLKSEAAETDYVLELGHMDSQLPDLVRNMESDSRDFVT